MKKKEDANIEKTIQTTCEVLIAQLRKQGLMSKGIKNSFQKTEQLLYNYNNFKEAIRDKEEQIKEIQVHGLPEKSKSITSWSGNSGLLITDPVSDKIYAIRESIRITERYIKTIDKALDRIRADQYYRIIELKYFDGKSGEEIAEKIGVDASTVTRNKNRLLNSMKIQLFTDEAIIELLC